MSKKQSVTDETRDFWSKASDTDVAEEDAREIIQNIAGFFGVLLEWSAPVARSRCYRRNGTHMFFSWVDNRPEIARCARQRAHLARYVFIWPDRVKSNAA